MKVIRKFLSTKQYRYGYTLMEIMIATIIVGTIAIAGIQNLSVLNKQSQCRRAQWWLLNEYYKQAAKIAMGKPNYVFPADQTLIGQSFVTSTSTLTVGVPPVTQIVIDGPFYACLIRTTDSNGKMIPLSNDIANPNPDCVTFPAGRNYCPSVLTP